MLISINVTNGAAVSAGLDCALTALAFEQSPTVVFIGADSTLCIDALSAPLVAQKLADLVHNNTALYYLAPEALDKTNTLSEQIAIPKVSATTISAILRTHEQCVCF